LGWKDRGALDRELANFREALEGVSVQEAFLPAASVSLAAQRTVNRYYASDEEYLHALADVLRVEYKAIVDAGFLVQLDAPELAIDRNFPEYRNVSIADYRKTVAGWVEAINYALEGIPAEKVRLHVCWGNNEGPHIWDVPLADLLDLVLKINASGYCIESANPRHGHEWQVWKDVQLPDGKILIPGVIDTSSNYVEHPELVAERIMRFADLVGRENVIAGTDCGFGTDAETAAVFEPVVWGKLKALSDGAALASRRLWSGVGV
jgi:5-methyltetrahydropteroyltriglutamate--homocysteine methyltransferase